MSEVMPDSLMNLTSSLTSPDISSSSLGGKFPDYIFQLPNLHKLDLSGNTDQRGTLPGSNWGSSLAFLSLAGCSFTGEVPHSVGSLPQSTSLDLSRNSFTSRVDFRTFSTLKNIRFLGLSGLFVLGEDATDANHEFPKLEKLVMFDSSLRNFPCFLSSMPELKEMYLFGSIISESPGQRANNGLTFPQLQTLYMVSCNLTKFLSYFSRSEKLRYLYLSENMIDENPGRFWGIGIDTLEGMYLENNPRSLVNCTYLETIDVGDNGIIDTSPVWLLPRGSLQVLNQRSNNFEGRRPTDVFLQSRSLQVIALSSKNFEGAPCPGHSTNSYLISNNGLSGEISCICNAANLRIPDLSNNSWTGTLPRCIENVAASLVYLNLRMNKFHGMFPEIFPEGSGLTSLDFSMNYFEGPFQGLYQTVNNWRFWMLAATR